MGYTGPVRRRGEFEQLEDELKSDFDRVRGKSRLRWDDAREATRAAPWRVTRKNIRIEARYSSFPPLREAAGRCCLESAAPGF